MTTDTTSNGMREAMSFLRQERRFFREALQRRGFLSRLFSAAPADDVSLDGELEVKQQRIINESAQRNELGLYRNASLTLACLQMSRGNFDTAINHLLDVAFLDMNGASNSIPGEKSFDRQLADLLPFISSIIRDAAMAAGLDANSLEQPFKSRWERFSSFEKPPYTSETTWRKLRKAIST